SLHRPSPPRGIPHNFYPFLLLFHAFPLHAVLTLFVLDAPFGRFARVGSRLNLNGNLAWFVMESVAPVTLITTLYQTDHPPLTPEAMVLSGLYLTHYFHRAVLSPLVYSPRRSPLHIVIPLLAAAWNLLNASLLATSLAFYPPETTLSSPRFWFGVAGWALGFAGNVYHDEILNDLRRPPRRRLFRAADQAEAEDKKASKGHYAIPHGGLFRYVSFPNYLCEWLEWSAFAFAAGPLFIPIPALSSLHLSGRLGRAAAGLGWWPTKLLSPGWMFVLAEISAMTPRAIRGHRWYRDTFGERFPRERKVVIPGLF
ncbi:hypothetical protein JCM24511_01545, partial [Saitozyma sp. JCM 24511]